MLHAAANSRQRQARSHLLHELGRHPFQLVGQYQEGVEGGLASKGVVKVGAGFGRGGGAVEVAVGGAKPKGPCPFMVVVLLFYLFV